MASDGPGYLVTGTSSGLGRAIAETLAGSGRQVLAGVRRPRDAPEHPAIEPVVLDTTDPQHLASLTTRLRDATVGRLVNNAGVAIPGAFEATTREQWRTHEAYSPAR